MYIIAKLIIFEAKIVQLAYNDGLNGD